jgi:S-adenosylmethionine hydrolase
MACITLLSDLGLQDTSVAMTKGILMQRNPAIPIIDITHEIRPFNMQHAAYMLTCAYKNFPEGSFHLVLFDVFSEAGPQLLLHEHGGHYFLVPNNGVLPMALGEHTGGTWLCYELAKAHSLQDWVKAAASIVHEMQTKTPLKTGLISTTLKSAGKALTLQANASEINCDVLHIDQYENVVLNITKQQLDAVGKPRYTVSFMQVEEINELSQNYSDVPAGYKLCRFNSNGFLEICINRGKAASLFGIRPGSKYNNIKIVFE